MSQQQDDLAKLADAFFQNLLYDPHPEYGSIGLDGKRPFGNSDVEADVLRIIEAKPEGDDGDDPCWASHQRAYAASLYKEHLVPYLREQWVVTLGKPPSPPAGQATIRKFPACESRVEDGPVQFGEDWPGLFLRGDTAMNYAYHLQIFLDEALHNVAAPPNPISLGVVRGLLSDLESCNLVTRAEQSSQHSELSEEQAIALVRKHFPQAVASQDACGWYVRLINGEGRLYGFLGRAPTGPEAWIQAAQLLPGKL